MLDEVGLGSNIQTFLADIGIRVQLLHHCSAAKQKRSIDSSSELLHDEIWISDREGHSSNNIIYGSSSGKSFGGKCF